MSQTANAEAKPTKGLRPLLAAIQAGQMVNALADSFVLSDSQSQVVFEVLAAYISQNEREFPLPEIACVDQVDSIFFARRPSLLAHS
ncbi:hypothetical protein MCEMIEM13_01622 [Comamonadaceae bacterium]